MRSCFYCWCTSRAIRRHVPSNSSLHHKFVYQRSLCCSLSTTRDELVVHSSHPLYGSSYALRYAQEANQPKGKQTWKSDHNVEYKLVGGSNQEGIVVAVMRQVRQTVQALLTNKEGLLADSSAKWTLLFHMARLCAPSNPRPQSARAS